MKHGDTEDTERLLCVLCVSVFQPLFVGQGKNIHRVTLVWRIDLGSHNVRNSPGAAPALSGCYADVLLTSDTERNGKTLHGGGEFRLPQHFAGLDVDGMEHLVPVTNESDSASCGYNCGHERC